MIDNYNLQCCFFKKGHRRPFFYLFSFFQTNTSTLTTNICEKMLCPSSIWPRGLNPQPLEDESPPKTTRQGLPPILQCCHISNQTWHFYNKDHSMSQGILQVSFVQRYQTYPRYFNQILMSRLYDNEKHGVFALGQPVAFIGLNCLMTKQPSLTQKHRVVVVV